MHRATVSTAGDKFFYVGVGVALTVLALAMVWALTEASKRKAACEAHGMTALSIGRGGLYNACAGPDGVMHKVPE